MSHTLLTHHSISVKNSNLLTLPKHYQPVIKETRYSSWTPTKFLHSTCQHIRRCITVNCICHQKRSLMDSCPQSANLMAKSQTVHHRYYHKDCINPLKPELNSICYLLALLGAHLFLHVSRIRVKSLILRLLMSYIYMEHLFLMFLDHTQ